MGLGFVSHLFWPWGMFVQIAAPRMVLVLRDSDWRSAGSGDLYRR
jgi:hypothetical protein